MEIILTLCVTFLIFLLIIMVKEFDIKNISSLLKTIIIILSTMFISSHYNMVITEGRIDELKNYIKELERDLNESKKN